MQQRKSLKVACNIIHTVVALARQLVAAARRETIFMVTKNFGSPKKNLKGRKNMGGETRNAKIVASS